MLPDPRPLAATLVLLLALSSMVRAVEGVSEDKSSRAGLKGPERFAAPQLAPASNASEKARSKFIIPPGFVTDTWAAEPLLGNPVAFCFDGKGRIYTSETNRYRTSVLDIRHYMFMLEDDLACRTTEDWAASIRRNFPNEWRKLGVETEVIRVLEDSNGDGKADQSSVVADGFNSIQDGIASGILEHDGVLWFTNMPNLWRLEGIGPDGRAQKKESISYGYGVRFSYTGHDMHGLAMGPDGRLYFSFGDRGAHVKTKEGKTLALSDEGGVFRCEPDGSHMEMVMRGLRNPQELAFDDHGNLFTGDNDSDQGDRERWVYVCEGADAGWRIGWQHNPLGKERNPWLTEHVWEPRKEGTPYYVLSPVANIPDGPSGLAYYPGTGMPEKYAGHFFLCGFKGSSAKSAISTWKNQPKGAGFDLVDQEIFIDHVQATDVAFGPDSKIYLSEWGEGWERNALGRIFRCYNPEALKAQAAEVEDVKKLLADGFKQRSSDELVKLLGHRDQRVRLNAQWALAEKPDAAQKFAAVAGNGTGLARLHGIWGLGEVARLAGCKQPSAEAAMLQPLLPSLDEKDAEVRANAAKVLGDGGVTAASAKLVKLLQDESPRVRYFAAQSLGKLGDRNAIPPLIALVRENADKDQYLRHAAVIALTSIGDKAALAAAAKDADKSVRLAALLAMYRLQMPEVATFLNDKEPLLVQEAVRVINDGPIPAAYGDVAKLIESGSKDEQLMLRVLNANLRSGRGADAAALAKYAANEGAPAGLRSEALTLLQQWPEPAARDHIVGIYRPLGSRDAAPAVAALKSVLPQLLRSPKADMAKEAICTAAALGLKSEAPAFLALVQNAKNPAKIRGAALQALADLGEPNLATAVKTALGDKDAGVRIEAMTLLGKLDPDDAAAQLSAAYAGSGIAEKKVILESLGSLKSAAAGKMLANLMAGFANQPGEVQLELLEAAGKRKEPEVKKAVKAYTAGLPQDNELAPFFIALHGGDKASGEKIFKEHAVAACLRCHKVNDEGGDAGPELGDIGKRQDRNYILESILNPNAKIAEGFQMYVVTMKDGNFYTGFLRGETADTLTIFQPGAETVTLKKKDIDTKDEAASGMLPGLGELLSKREIRDLVEYCASLKK